jgi:hypothetical protein
MVELLVELAGMLADLRDRHQRTRGRPLRIVLFSDHGCGRAKVRHAEGIDRALREAGLHVVRRLAGPRDVVAPQFGLVNFGALFLQDAGRAATAAAAIAATSPTRSRRAMPSASRSPAAPRASIARRARRRSAGARSVIQRGSDGGSGARLRAGAVARPLLAFGAGSFAGVSSSATACFRAARAASGDAGASAARAAPIPAFASVSERNGPLTRASPRSSVCSASTTTHVPDWGSIVNRSSRVCQRPPPRRFRAGSSSVLVGFAMVPLSIPGIRRCGSPPVSQR